MAVEVPTITHLVCKVEAGGIVVGMSNRTTQLLNGWLASLGCECVEYPPAILVNAWMQQALDEWWNQQTWAPGYPAQHSPQWCQPAPIVEE